MKSKKPRCPKCDGATFELRVVKDERVAAARCVKCSANYLLLDSKDYWFDVIQEGYPPIKRCACKNTSFRLRIDYNYRDDGDIDYIEVHSTCSVCGKTRLQMDFEVDYFPTKHLFAHPLIPCKNPKILYDLKDINLLVTLEDMARIVNHLGHELNCKFSCWLLSQGKRDPKTGGVIWIKTDLGVDAVQLVIRNGRYLYIYAMPKRIKVDKEKVDSVEREDTFWKRNEVIRIGSKTHVCKSGFGICYCSDGPSFANYIKLGLSFYINFSNEYVQGEKVIPKSKSFQRVTAGFLDWLKEQFVSWRGPHCFDNPQINVRIFGERFRKKARAKPSK